MTSAPSHVVTEQYRARLKFTIDADELAETPDGDLPELLASALVGAFVSALKPREPDPDRVEASSFSLAQFMLENGWRAVVDHSGLVVLRAQDGTLDFFRPVEV